MDVAISHTILALSLFCLSCSPKLGTAHKNGGGSVSEWEWLIHIPTIFCNTNYQLKNLKENTAGISVSSSIDSYFF